MGQVKVAARRRLRKERRERAQQEALEAALGPLGQERKEAARAKARRRRELQELFWTYDTNHSQVLEEDQLVKLLTDLDDSTPKGTVPTDSELAFVKKSCGADDGMISFAEFEDAINAWRCYCEKRDEMKQVMQEFDSSGTGKLELTELQKYLTKLNHGKEVSAEDAQFVLDEADFYGDGAVGVDELVMATASWYHCPLGPDTAEVVLADPADPEKVKASAEADAKAATEAEAKEAETTPLVQPKANQSACCTIT